MSEKPYFVRTVTDDHHEVVRVSDQKVVSKHTEKDKAVRSMGYRLDAEVKRRDRLDEANQKLNEA